MINLPKAGRGGSREGSGRPTTYGEPTKVMRIPESQIDFVKFMLGQNKEKTDHKTDLNPQLNGWSVDPDHNFNPIPLSDVGVSAGPVSFVETQVMRDVIDLDFIFGSNPTSRFAIRVISESMLNAGIAVNDILAVNRSIEARHKDIVVAKINGEFTVKRLMIEKVNHLSYQWLKAENPEYQNIYFKENEQVEIWGVVMCVLKRFRGK